MAVITDPDSLSRFDVIFGTESQKVSLYPIGQTQRIIADTDFTSVATGDVSTVFGATALWALGDRVYVTTSGADLPDGLAIDTEYYIGSIGSPSADDFKFYATQEAAINGGTPVTISDSGTGTHTVHTNAVVDAWVGTTGTIEKMTNWVTGVVAGDVVAIQNTVNAGHYYVKSVSTTTITIADIDAGTGGTTATSLTTGDSASLNAGTISSNNITATAHGYNDGDEVVYDSGAGAVITGLADGGVYYIIRVDENTIAFASTYANAIADTPTKITISDPTGSTANVLHDRLIVSIYTNGANVGENSGASGEATAGAGGAELGTIADGVTMQALYSYSKEEWKDDSIASDEYRPANDTSNEGNIDSDEYVNDLIRFEIPFESITSEQFEIGGGAAHDDWAWFNQYTRKKVRTGGWADKQQTGGSTNDTERWTGIITLGSLDSDTQVYYQQLHVENTPSDFTFLGAVNEPIRIWLDSNRDLTPDTDEDKTTFLKLFARKKARSYAQSEIADIGVSTIQTIVNRFPLAHATDAAITESDGAILGKAPWRDIITLATGTDGLIDRDADVDTFTSALGHFDEEHCIVAEVNTAGTGYTVGDTLTIDATGASASDVMQLTVATITGGGATGPIGSFTISIPGNYGTLPSNLTNNTLTGGTGSSATADLRFAKINPGDTITMTSSAESTTSILRSWTVKGVTNATTLTVADDADFTTDWSSVKAAAVDETDINFTVNTTVVAADTSSQANTHQDLVTAGTGANGIIDVGTASNGVIYGKLEDGGATDLRGAQKNDVVLITDTKEVLVQVLIKNGGTNHAVDDVLTLAGTNWSTQPTVTVKGVSSGAITKVIISEEGAEASPNPTLTGLVSGTTGSGTNAEFVCTVSGKYNGAYKVVDSTSGSGIPDPADTTVHVNTGDVAFTGEWPSSVEGTVSYQIRKSGMYLQFKQGWMDSGAEPASYAFVKNTGTTLDTLTRSAGTWDTNIKQGTVIEVTNATNTGTNDNNGFYTVQARTSDTVLTLVATSANEASDRFEESVGTDSTAIVTAYDGFIRTVGKDVAGNDASFGFNWRLFGNDGTLGECFQFVQHQMRQSTDIDFSGANKRGDINDLLMSFATPTGTGLNMYIDDLNTSDINNVTLQDATATNRTFPFTSSGNLSFNKNLTDDGTSKYWLFFANSDAATVDLGLDYGTKDAIIVNDSTGTAIQGTVNGSTNHTGITRTPDSAGTILIPFTFDYDGNTQRGAGSAGVDAPVKLVAIGLSSAQFVVSDGTITQATGLTISATAALERNYSNV